MGLHVMCFSDKDLPLPIKYKRANHALSLATHPFDCTRSSRPCPQILGALLTPPPFT